MEPNDAQAQGLYRICYRLTNAIYPGWPYTSIELVRMDERTGNLYVFAGEEMGYEVNKAGGYEP